MRSDAVLDDIVPVEFGINGFSRLSGVSYCLLLERLNMSGVKLLHVPRPCSKRFSWYVSVPGKREVSQGSYHKDVLFLCHEEMAEELLKAFPSCFCVVATNEDCAPEWAAEKDRRNRVIVFKSERRFYYYDSLLQALFVNDLMWENEMDRIVYNRGKLDRLIAVSEKMLANFVCITDTGFNLISYSRSIEPPSGLAGKPFRRLVDNNCYDKEIITIIEERVLSVAKEKNEIIVCEPWGGQPGGGVPTLHYPIFIEGAYLFHVVMICNRGSLETLRDLFSKFTRRVLAICSEFWRNTVNLEAPWHRALIGLINGDALTDEYLDVQLSATAIPASRQFRLLCFCFDSCKTYKERSKVVEVAKSLNNGDAYPFMYEDHLLVLYYSSSSEDAALSGRRIYADLGNHVFTPHGVACGASQVFFNIEDIPFAYRQALAAYSMRAPLKRELESLTGNAEIPCYPFEHVLKYYVLVEGRDSDLVEFSFHGSILERLAEEDKIEDTSIIQMIWAYLNSGRNATETAKMVHVHRNTVLYHVSRLEKRFDISFDSPLLRSRMLLDFQRLLLEGKI